MLIGRCEDRLIIALQPFQKKFPALLIEFREAEKLKMSLTAKGKIGYTDIPRIVEAAVAAAPSMACDSLAAVLEADRWSRSFARR